MVKSIVVVIIKHNMNGWWKWQDYRFKLFRLLMPSRAGCLEKFKLGLWVPSENVSVTVIVMYTRLHYVKQNVFVAHSNNVCVCVIDELFIPASQKTWRARIVFCNPLILVSLLWAIPSLLRRFINYLALTIGDPNLIISTVETSLTGLPSHLLHPLVMWLNLVMSHLLHPFSQ